MHEFGHRLRALRRERGRSQAELGGGRYSASYISHLESGRRKPTMEIVAHLTTTLGIPATDLLGLALGEDDNVLGIVELTTTEFEVNAAWDDRDFDSVVTLAEQSAAAARRLNRPDALWNATFRKAEALLMIERYDECLTVTEELARHRVAAMAPDLRAQALALSSKAARAHGLLTAALATAQHAVEAAAESRNRGTLVSALLADIAANAELGRLTDAEKSASRIEGLLEEIPRGHLAGLAEWSVGNIAFLQGDTARGIRHHDVAARSLRPNSDLRAWGRFNKASAAMRLGAGVTDDVDRLIEAADYALRLVGNDGDRLELALVRAERALGVDPADTLEHVRAAVEGAPLPAHTLAEAALLRARAFDLMSQPDDAHEQLIEAAHLFEEAGAESRALPIWRLVAGSGTAECRSGSPSFCGRRETRRH